MNKDSVVYGCDGLLTFRRVSLQDIMLSEIRQSQEDKYRIPLTGSL